VERARELALTLSNIFTDQKRLNALGVQGTFVLWREQIPFFCNVCFYYIPPALAELKGTPFWEFGEGDVRCDRIRKVCVSVCVCVCVCVCVVSAGFTFVFYVFSVCMCVCVFCVRGITFVFYVFSVCVCVLCARDFVAPRLFLMCV
jgi:hypothetical protein